MGSKIVVDTKNTLATEDSVGAAVELLKARALETENTIELLARQSEAASFDQGEMNLLVLRLQVLSGSVQEELAKAAEHLDKLENDWYRKEQEAAELRAAHAAQEERRRREMQELKSKLPLGSFALPGRWLQGWTERVIEL